MTNDRTRSWASRDHTGAFFSPLYNNNNNNLYLCVKSKIAVIQPLTGDTLRTNKRFVMVKGAIGVQFGLKSSEWLEKIGRPRSVNSPSINNLNWYIRAFNLIADGASSSLWSTSLDYLIVKCIGTLSFRRLGIFVPITDKNWQKKSDILRQRQSIFNFDEATCFRSDFFDRGIVTWTGWLLCDLSSLTILPINH